MRLGFWVSVVSRSQFLWWRHGLNRLGLVLCFGGVDRRLVLWVDFGVLMVAKFQFHDDCWRHWVCCGGACNGNVK